MQQIALGKTLDVEVVEQELAALWQGAVNESVSPDKTEVRNDTEPAVVRARAANLLVFVTEEHELNEAHELLPELTAAHPSRVLTIFADNDATDQDIEMYVSAFSQDEKRTGSTRLCCEEVTLKAQGSFVSELPSAALPLLVSDLPTFLWWRADIGSNEKLFRTLSHASDRLILDSVEFQKPAAELPAVNEICKQHQNSWLGVSDLNWARLTSWRGLLADFYDVYAYQKALDAVDVVRIDYVSPEYDAKAIAPQALLMAGWLASRLQWTVTDKTAITNEETTRFEFHNAQSQPITLELNRIQESAVKPGRLTRVELQSSKVAAASFKVERTDDLQRVLTEADLGTEVHGGRVLPVRNRSTAQLLSREMEILCNDQMYEEALAVAAILIDRLTHTRN